MTTSNNFRQKIQTIPNLGMQVINYISGAVARIFGVRDDDYPATGVQPYEGEPAKKQDF
ncbi:hypothetical protein Nos7524_1839 [Nostoc sp. PCC 7524]|uniref:hypothetical protein n=1 Tax=Nostoc sp. (strain ATCC 29411 / PCC 7524) TaxID=28072 RepID=UPI00029F1A25|nr:hypothetical protein [Nostoc sp. PCC 7524]AFY47701.1 hypothetical protein Nos7524_1839 [Nostoc sp. PCC 7524]